MILTNPTTCDVIIVGAGPAGAAAAYDLCRAGKSVLLLDRHEFPRHKACAGGLTVKTLNVLRYPVDPVIRHRCRSLAIGKGLSRSVHFESRRDICAMTVRSELDTFCLEKTLAAGARFRTIARIRSVRETRDFVDIRTDAGLLRAPFLIGADGAHSRIRKLSGEFQDCYQGFAIEGRVPADPGKRPRMTFDFNVAPSGYGWLFPKNDHVNIGLFTSNPSVTLTKRDLLAYAQDRLGHSDVRHLSGHPMGLGGWRYRPHCRRILLAGDAAGLVDPLLGEGLYNAIRSGQLAARAVILDDSAHTSAGSIYNRLLETVRRDLRLCRLSALCFYRLPNFGYWALTSKPVKYALVEGYARGWPLGRIETQFYRLPFLTY